MDDIVIVDCDLKDGRPAVFDMLIIAGIVLAVVFSILAGFYLHMQITSPFEERHIEQVALIREHFGEETSVYPTRTSTQTDGKYYIITPYEEVNVVYMWLNNDSFDFEVVMLEEPFLTEREEELYRDFIYARRYNGRFNNPYE